MYFRFFLLPAFLFLLTPALGAQVASEPFLQPQEDDFKTDAWLDKVGIPRTTKQDPKPAPLPLILTGGDLFFLDLPLHRCCKCVFPSTAQETLASVKHPQKY